MPEYVYHSIEETDVENLRKLIGDDQRVLFGDAISEDYSHDELGGTESWPDVVIKATSTNDVSNVMKYAWEHAIPVTPRGRGNGACWLVCADGAWHRFGLELDESHFGA